MKKLAIILLLLLVLPAEAHHVRDPTPKDLAIALDPRVKSIDEEEAPLGQRVLKQQRNSQGRDVSWDEMARGRALCEIGQSGTRGECIPRGRIEELLLSPKRTPRGWQL